MLGQLTTLSRSSNTISWEGKELEWISESRVGRGKVWVDKEIRRKEGRKEGMGG